MSLMREEYRITPYKDKDLEEILLLFDEAVHSVCAADYSPAQLDAWSPQPPDRDAWRESLGRSYTLVARGKAGIAGFANLAGTDLLDRLYIRADCRKQGIAGALADCLERRARERGAARILTEASITARPFFERRGYFLLREQQVFRRGEYLTNFLMEKPLYAAAS